MALYPFIIFREKELLEDVTIMNHELIHHRQQLEMWIVPFYFFYLLNYGVNRFRYKGHDAAYRNIIFEREAYAKENEAGYLKERKPFSFMNYYRSEGKLKR